MKKKYFLKNQSSFQRKVIASSLSVTFSLGAINVCLCTDEMQRLDTCWYTKREEISTSGVIAFVVFVALIVVIIGSTSQLLKDKTDNTNSKRQDTEPNDDIGEQDADKNESEEKLKEDSIRKSKMSKFLSATKFIVINVSGAGVGVGACALGNRYFMKRGTVTITNNNEKCVNGLEKSSSNMVKPESENVVFVKNSDVFTKTISKDEVVKPEGVDTELKVNKSKKKVDSKVLNANIDSGGPNRSSGAVKTLAKGNQTK